MKWNPINTAPTDGREILVAFFINEGAMKGVFVPFVANANGEDTRQHGYAEPTLWTDIVIPTEYQPKNTRKLSGV